MTLDHEILVSARVADLLRAHGIGVVRSVLRAEGRDPLPFAQLMPEGTLPRFLATSTGITRERPCAACGRDGYFGIPHVPMALGYPCPAPSGADLLATFERFGNSRRRTPLADSVFAAPLYLASARLADFLRAQRFKGVHFAPVEFAEATG
jgi:hypothetical protein